MIGLEGAANLLMSGAIAVMAFRLNLAALTQSSESGNRGVV
jgi:hypothetical protein